MFTSSNVPGFNSILCRQWFSLLNLLGTVVKKIECRIQIYHVTEDFNHLC